MTKLSILCVVIFTCIEILLNSFSIQMTLEEAIGYVASDELIEVTFVHNQSVNHGERFVCGFLCICIVYWV